MLPGMTEFEGYMIRAKWDGNLLHVHGTTKPARMALNGKDHADDVILSREQITDVKFKPAGVLINGRIVIWSVEGRKYLLHFRRKQQEGMTQLARELGAQT